MSESETPRFAPRMKARLGPAVLGEATTAFQNERKRKGMDRYGPMVVPRAAPADAPPPVDTDRDDDGHTTLAELGQSLKEHPEWLDRLIAVEKGSDAPRKGAWKLFLEQERAAATPRPEVIAELEQLHG